MTQLGHDETLVASARGGDRAAQETLWRANRRWVAAIVLAHRPRYVEVDDLMQDVAIKFVDKLETLRDAGSLRPWLRQIAINACRGAARRSRPTLRLASSEQAEPHEVGMPVSSDGSGDSTSDVRDSAALVMERAMSLPSEYREPLLMRCLYEMSYQQIGDILELPVTTIETRLARARRMLREEIGDAVGKGDGGRGND